MRVSQAFTRLPGTRPAQPVIEYTPPDDWLCCWSCRVGLDGKPFWELKFIHYGCRQHGYGKLKAA